MSTEEPTQGGVLIRFPSSAVLPTPAREEPAEEAQPSQEVPTSRGVETLFRSVYNTHLTLHSMADNKSRMMIQVDGLILSVLFAGQAHGGGPVSAADLGSGSLALIAAASVSLLLAVLAVRPRGERRSPRTGRAQAGSGGLLFFSEFAGMSRDEYVAGMNALMRQPAALYESMSSNLHTIGSLLERKYRLLRWSYAALAVGVAAACLLQLGLGALAYDTLR